MSLEVRSYLGYNGDKVSRLSGLECADKSLTVQDTRDECDINVIVARFGITGTMPQGMVPPKFGDFDGISDYRTALEAVMNAEEQFMEVPADIRAKFDNDPQRFLEFCSDEKNLDAMRKMGLAVPLPEPPPEPPVAAPK